MIWDFFQRFVLFAKDNSVVRRIAWLTVMGLLVSVSALILVLSVMTALNRSQRERFLAVEPHLMVEMLETKDLSAVLRHPAFTKMSQSPGAQVQAFETQDVIVRTLDGKFHGAIARGQSEVSLKDLIHGVRQSVKVWHGEASNESPPGEGEVMIGTDLAHALGVFEGDTLLVIPPEGLLLPPTEAPKFEKVRVEQVLTTNVPEVDGQQLFYQAGATLKTLRDTASRRLGFEVRWPDPDLAEIAKVDLSGFSDIRVQTWKERNSALFLALRLEKIMIGIFLGMAALVAGLSLVSVLTLLISQKRREIGLLQALGYSRMGVRNLFTKLGLLLAMMGLGSGLLLGTAASLYLEWRPLNILPDIYYDSEIPAEVQMPFVVIVAGIGLALAVFGARWAANSTAESSPSQLLMGRRP